MSLWLCIREEDRTLPDSGDGHNRGRRENKLLGQRAISTPLQIWGMCSRLICRFCQFKQTFWILVTSSMFKRVEVHKFCQWGKSRQREKDEGATTEGTLGGGGEERRPIPISATDRLLIAPDGGGPKNTSLWSLTRRPNKTEWNTTCLNFALCHFQVITVIL